MQRAASIAADTSSARSLSAANVQPLHQPVWEMLAAVLVGLIAHHSVVHGTFHQDDSAILTASLAAGTSWSTLGDRPLLYLTMQFNHWLGEKNPFGYHVFNLIGHALAVAGMYLVVAALQVYTQRVLRHSARPRPALAPGWGATRSFLPLYAALFFAVHPLASEAVAYVMARTNGWGGALFLWSWGLGVLAFMPSAGAGRSSGTAGRVLLGLGSVICFLLSFGFKETHVFLVVLLPLSLWLAHPGRGLPFGWRAAGVFLLLLGLGGLLVWRSWGLVERVWYQFGTEEPLLMLASNSVAVLWNWWRMLFPHPLTLDYDLAFREIDQPVVWAAMAGHVVLLAAAWWAGRKRPWLRIATALAYLNLALTNSVVMRFDLWSDRNGYLSFAAGCVVLAGLFQEAGIRLRTLGPRARPMLAGRCGAFVALLVIWLGALGFLTHRRDRLYADTEAFWVDAVAQAPRHPRAVLQLALIREEFGRGEEARAGYEKTLDLCDDEVYFGHAHRFVWRAMAEERLAQMDLASGELEDARERLEMAVSDNPLDANALRTLCQIYLKLEDGEEVVFLLDEAHEDGTMPLGVEEEAVLRKEALRLIEKFKDNPKPRGGTFKGMPEAPPKQPDQGPNP